MTHLFLFGSIADSNSLDAESGFDEGEVSEVSSGVSKVISRFVEKVRDRRLTENVCIIRLSVKLYPLPLSTSR